MIERQLDITTTDGEMPTFVVRPEKRGPHSVVLFQMDAPGMRSEIHNMARRFAKRKLAVLTCCGGPVTT